MQRRVLAKWGMRELRRACLNWVVNTAVAAGRGSEEPFPPTVQVEGGVLVELTLNYDCRWVCELFCP